MNVDFFIKRPIFTSVCSFVIILAGLICIPILPVAQFPNLVPPMITVSANYIGASSEDVESAVTTPLEQNINGVEGMTYMKSQSGNNGNSTVNVFFDLNRDKDIASVDVQNQVSSALGLLPEDVKRTGVTVSKQSTNIVVGYAFYSKDHTYSNVFISNYLDKYVTDEIKRIKGVGSVSIVGERKYSMRVWLNPSKLSAKGLTASDVVNAIKEQNVQVPAGQIGAPPNNDNQMFQYNILANGRLTDPKQFENIVIKTGSDGSLVKLRDVGYSELGAQDYSSTLRFNKNDAVGLMVYQLSDANALQVFENVTTKMNELIKKFPPGLDAKVGFETNSVVKESIHEVEFTLYLSIFLVILVIYMFLQSFRMTLIPIITIPVSLLGTFALLKLFGFSINTLSLFGLVLATGLVVDDAIVVIENIERYMHEKNMNAIDAALASMKEVSGAIIACTIVIAAVFIPVAIYPGTTGVLYKQFAMTIVFSMLISLFNALTLSPALAAILLKHSNQKKLSFLIYFESIINAARNFYHKIISIVVCHKAIVSIVFVSLLVATFLLLKLLPTGFVPSEDQGYFIITVQGPEGTSINYTNDVIKDIESTALKIPGVENIYAIGAFSFTGNNSNCGTVFVTLKPFHDRKSKEQSAKYIVLELNKKFKFLDKAIVVAFEPPPIQGIGNLGGLEFQLLDKSSGSLQDFAKQKDNFILAVNKSPVIANAFTSFSANTPLLNLIIDRDKAKVLGVSLTNIFNTLQILLGSQYVNDFSFLNKVYRVYVQADKDFRANPNIFKSLYVRSDSSNELIPLSSFLSGGRKFTSQTITHFNLFRSAEINASPSPRYSSGQAIKAMENLASEVLPQDVSYQWSGLSLEQKKAGTAGIIIFGLGIIMVYLVLAAQYENLIDPFIILFAVPLALLGALLAQYLRGLENDVYCQIGLVMLVGLACKNSILIVEFANHLISTGKKPLEAVIEAASTRFRPIIMTSMAFILGIFPLVIATGAGSLSRNSMGTAVFGGMFFSTILSLMIVPVLFLIIKEFEERLHKFIKGKKHN